MLRSHIDPTAANTIHDERELARASWVLAAVYLLLFAYVGVFLPWFPPLLEERGFSPRLIGIALALASASRILLPPLWGVLADRVEGRRHILALASLLASGAMLALVPRWAVSVTLVWVFAHGFFLVPLFPLAETVTMNVLGRRRQAYGRIRLWGSVGFIVSSLGLGALIRRLGVEIVPIAAGAPLLLAGFVVLMLPGSAGERRGRISRPEGSMPWRTLGLLVLTAALGQASHGPYYAFFTLQMKARGVGPAVIGSLWALAVACEVVLMACSPRLLARVGLLASLRWALLLSAVRWLVYASEPTLFFIAMAQLLHAASFGLLHIASVQLVDHTTPDGAKALGQSLLSSVAYGGGIGIGLFAAGMFIDRWGDAGLYLAASTLAAAGLLLSVSLPRTITSR